MGLRGRDQSNGATLVEFALILPLLVLLLFGIVEFGWAFAQNLDVKHVAREVGRLASVDEPTSRIDDYCTGDLAQVTAITRSGPTLAGSAANITVTATLQQITGLFGWALSPIGVLSSTVEVRLEQDATKWNGSDPCP